MTDEQPPERTSFDYVCIGVYAIILLVLSPIVVVVYLIGRGVARLADKHGYEI